MSKSRWLYGFLGLSVAANIFIFGVVLGNLNKAKERVQKFRGAPRAEITLREIGRQLDRPDRRFMRQLARERMDMVQDLFDERRALQDQIKVTISADTLDLDALRAQLARLREIEFQFRSMPEEIMFQVLPRMDKAARERLADTLFERKGPPNDPPHGPGRRFRPPPSDQDAPPPDDFLD